MCLSVFTAMDEMAKQGATHRNIEDTGALLSAVPHERIRRLHSLLSNWTGHAHRLQDRPRWVSRGKHGVEIYQTKRSGRSVFWIAEKSSCGKWGGLVAEKTETKGVCVCDMLVDVLVFTRALKLCTTHRPRVQINIQQSM